MRPKRNLVEGVVFSVPLESGGYALGVLARTNGKGKAFGYFFKPTNEVSLLKMQDSIMVARFGDHGLHTGRWQVIGSLEGWSRAQWPLPDFTREHDDPKLAFLTRYDDALEVISEKVVPANSLCGEYLPKDAQYGSGVIEKLLSRHFPDQQNGT